MQFGSGQVSKQIKGSSPLVDILQRYRTADRMGAPVPLNLHFIVHKDIARISPFCSEQIHTYVHTYVPTYPDVSTIRVCMVMICELPILVATTDPKNTDCTTMYLHR